MNVNFLNNIIKLPVFDQILIYPSSPAVTNEYPSLDHFNDITAPLCASITFFSTFPNLFISLKLPSPKPIAKLSFKALVIG